MTPSPGPWRVIHTESSIGAPLVRVVDVNGKAICDNEPYYPTALDPANADLIAAAPSMFSILQSLVRELKSVSNAKKEWLDPNLERIADDILEQAKGR